MTMAPRHYRVAQVHRDVIQLEVIRPSRDETAAWSADFFDAWSNPISANATPGATRESVDESAIASVLGFLDLINPHDVDKLAESMTEDPRLH